MMNAQDLMVGDWVIVYEKAKPVKARVDGVYGNNAFVLGHPRIVEKGFVEPIPITPEILEKNFRVVERSSDGYNLVINSELILAFHLKATLDFWIAQPRDCPNLTYSLPLPRYVHELQHALRICGIDKEIVL